MRIKQPTRHTESLLCQCAADGFLGEAEHPPQPGDNVRSRSFTLSDAYNPARSSDLNEKPKYVLCQLCEGRKSNTDQCDKDGLIFYVTRACPACKGQGLVDIAHGIVSHGQSGDALDELARRFPC